MTLYQNARHTLAEPPVETPEQAATVNLSEMKDKAAELDKLGLGKEWCRWDRGSFVSAGHVDGAKTIVGNSGGWWAVQLVGRSDKQLVEKLPSAQAAFAATAPKVKLAKQ